MDALGSEKWRRRFQSTASVMALTASSTLMTLGPLSEYCDCELRESRDGGSAGC
jgi:hypothetical protein